MNDQTLLNKISKVGKYDEDLHSESQQGLMVGECGYRYRIIDGVVLPPYVTPDRYAVSRTITTRPGDVCYCSFPKSGSTWLANVLYLIINKGELPEDRTLRSCLHWMESSWPYPRSREEVDALPSPRIFKSHMPYSMALGGDPAKSPCKYIYIARNPKDVCVSYFHFESGKAWSGNYSGSWEHWLDLFTRGQVQRGSWFDHVLSWWQHRDAENLLFLRYEDLKRDFDGQLARMLEFLGYEVSTEVLDTIRKFTTFESMKTKEFSNHKQIAELEGFFRKGTIGSWKEQFTVAQSEAFDRLYETLTAGTGLEFDFE
ncbi:MAG: sulfotransferase domain-containing protein [Pseudohongiellaceae bacterium]